MKLFNQDTFKLAQDDLDTYLLASLYFHIDTEELRHERTIITTSFNEFLAQIGGLSLSLWYFISFIISGYISFN